MILELVKQWMIGRPCADHVLPDLSVLPCNDQKSVRPLQNRMGWHQSGSRTLNINMVTMSSSHHNHQVGSIVMWGTEWPKFHMVIQGKYFYEQRHLIPEQRMKNTVFPHKLWRPFSDWMPRLYFRPQYVWFPVHLEGALIPLWCHTLVVNRQNQLFILFHQSRSVLSPNPVMATPR